VALPGVALLGGLRIRVAVVAPHPDDFEAIAVTLRWLHQRDSIIELGVLTRGVSGVEDGYGGARTAEEKARLREGEQRRSAAEFGLEP